MHIRSAREEDADLLVPLLSQMGYPLSIEKMRARILAFDVKTHQLLVAELDNKIIGMIAFGLYEHLRLEGSCCHVDTLVIDQDHRHLGIGKKLIGYAEEFAMKKKCKTIELTTANHRKPGGTHAFYEALGYKNHDQIDCTYFAKDINRE